MNCIFCSKECKLTDSKPYPNPRSQGRIHFRCHVKKSLSDKKSKDPARSTETCTTKPRSSFSLSTEIISEKSRIEKQANQDKLTRVIESKARQNDGSASTFFFDIKAGIAKPHEKRHFLHHRNLSEIGSRYNDQGFQDEAIGRAYDHRGKDLMTLGDDSDEESGQQEDSTHTSTSMITKRKQETAPESFKAQKRPRVNIDAENPCWFCLSSSKIEKHLIISIGEHCYLALAKGGLVDEHFLIVPIEHVQSCHSEQNSEETLVELEDFKRSLINFFKDQSKGVVFFERNFRSVHWQLQVIPVPLEIIDGLRPRIGSISEQLTSCMKYIDIPKNCKISDIVPPKAPYFYWQIEPIGTRFVCQIQLSDKHSIFPIQIGRQILADENILNCASKIDWKQCVKTPEEYTDLVASIRVKYKPYQITE